MTQNTYYTINTFMDKQITMDTLEVALYIRRNEHLRIDKFNTTTVKLIAYQTVSRQGDKSKLIKMYNTFINISPTLIENSTEFINIYIQNYKQTFESNGHQISFYNKQIVNNTDETIIEQLHKILNAKQPKKLWAPTHFV